MDFNATIDLIIRELDEAREIIGDLKNFQGAPLAEIELAGAKCRNAAEVLVLLKKPEKEEAPKGKADEPKAEQIENSKAITGISEKQELTKEAIKEIAEKPADSEKRQKTVSNDEPERHHESTKKTAPVQKNEKTETPEKETPENQPKKPYVAPIVADTFSHLASRFNEQMGAEREQEFSFMKKKSWSDLSHEIGINDQFYFIREIFNGNRNLYQEAISKLDKAENIADARNVIMSYRTEKTENEAVNQLLDLVKRKFSPNE